MGIFGEGIYYLPTYNNSHKMEVFYCTTMTKQLIINSEFSDLEKYKLIHDRQRNIQ